MDREDDIEENPRNSTLLATLSTGAVLVLAFLLATSPLFFSQKILANHTEEEGKFATYPPVQEPIPEELTLLEGEELVNNDLSVSTEVIVVKEDEAPKEIEVVLPAKPFVVLANPTVQAHTNNSNQSSSPISNSQNSVGVSAYWVAVKSYNTRYGAIEARQTMAEKGFSSYIETTQDDKGNIMYHLRIGSWSNQQEAERFKGFIQAIKGFETAYIVKSK